MVIEKLAISSDLLLKQTPRDYSDNMLANNKTELRGD